MRLHQHLILHLVYMTTTSTLSSTLVLCYFSVEGADGWSVLVCHEVLEIDSYDMLGAPRQASGTGIVSDASPSFCCRPAEHFPRCRSSSKARVMNSWSLAITLLVVPTDATLLSWAVVSVAVRWLGSLLGSRTCKAGDGGGGILDYLETLS